MSKLSSITASMLFASTLTAGCGPTDSEADRTPSEAHGDPAAESVHPSQPSEPVAEMSGDAAAGVEPDAAERRHPWHRPEPYVIGLLPDTQGGTDAEGQSHVAQHPMREVIAHQVDAGADLIIALGDLTDNGTSVEWAEWREVADEFRDSGVEYLPLMGNHEGGWAYTWEWINNMRNYIPADAEHMPGAEWVNYAIVRENVLVIALAYYQLPIAFDWVQTVVEDHEGDVDHIVVASHDGLIGAKYGQTREQIVDGTKDDNWVYDVQPAIREFFSDHDVIYVQGHEHQYQRSLVTKRNTLETYPSSSTPNGGNYRMGAYTQIMAGNASYKGYEFRWGERELVQAIISQKNATLENGSDHYDVNSSLLTFQGDRVDYVSYYAEHTAHSNAPEEAFEADWKLLDRFSRGTDRCEAIIYPDSVPDSTRAVLVLNTDYITNDCVAQDGSVAYLMGGTNATFNRTDTRTRDLSPTPGFSRAETLNDMVRLAFQWLYIYPQPWTPNLNSAARVVPDETANEMVIPETTIDLKEHVTLSWLPEQRETESEVLVISGTANQNGVYQGAYGTPKDIEVDPGLTMSQTDGTPKAPRVLPEAATRDWPIEDAVADAYAVSFVGREGLYAGRYRLGHRVGDDWQPVADAACVVAHPWDASFLDTPPARDAACDGQPLVGFDGERTWWAVLTQDAELALVRK